MPVDFNSKRDRTQPQNSHLFSVEVDGTEVGGFTDVYPPEVVDEKLHYSQGGNPGVTEVFPGGKRFTNAVLLAGAVTVTFAEWILDAVTDAYNVLIKMRNGDREPKLGWELIDATPARVRGPRLRSDGTGYAMKRVELAPRDLEVIQY